MSKAPAHSFDFCSLQRLINSIGGSPEHPSYAHFRPEYFGDKLSVYGFQRWDDMAAHLPKGPDYHSKYPHRPGCYAISVVPVVGGQWQWKQVGYERLLYIGSAVNINKRLNYSDHWLRKIERRFRDKDVEVVVRVLLTDNYLWAERSLIRNLRPLLNIQHNG